MPSVNGIQTNFSAGELSPLLLSRVDIAKYANGCKDITNFVIQRFGGARKRGGSEYIEGVKTNASKVRLIPFIYSSTQAYILEFGDEYIRFYTNGGQVVDGSAVEIVSPYTQDDLAGIQFAQSADVLYLAHPSYAPRKLVRNSATSFTLSIVEFEDGPFLEINTDGTYFTPASRGSLTPDMNNNTSPSGTASASADVSNAYKAFDADKNSRWAAGVTEGWIRYDLGSGNSAVVDAYWLTATYTADVDRTPSIWTIEGSDDASTWVTMDSQQNETGWFKGETRFYEMNNKTAYRYHRFSWQNVDGNNGNSELGEIGFHRAATDQTPFNLTSSGTTGINSDSGFSADDIGRPVRILGADGVWRWAKLEAYTSSTVMTVSLYDHALPDDAALNTWRLGAWSEDTGWPACVSFFEGRIAYANTSNQPQTVWISQTDAFEDFGISDPLLDTDAISATVRSDSVNDIKWIAEGTNLFIGTSAAVRTLGPNTSTGAFSSTNLLQKRESSYGASDVQPVQIGNVLVYSGFFKKDIREIAYSFENDGYNSQELSILSEHFLRQGVKEMAYQQNPDSVVWIVTDDGALCGMTYERAQDVIAFHGHDLGGINVTVESVATIPGSGFDEVWLVVKREVDGADVRYIERLSRGLDDIGDLDDATFLDCHLNYSGSSTTALTGLGHLEGESVKVWSDVGAQGPYTVSSGAITVGAAVTKACVGFSYTSTLETLSPEAGAAGGVAQTRQGHNSEVFLRLNRCQGGKVGPPDGTLESIEYEDATIYTGDKRVPISQAWGRDKRTKVEHTEHVPFHILGMVFELRVSG